MNYAVITEIIIDKEFKLLDNQEFSKTTFIHCIACFQSSSSLNNPMYISTGQ